MSTVDRMDQVFGTAPGVALSFFADYRSNKLLEDVFGRHKNFQKKIVDTYGPEWATKYGKGTHPIRRLISKATGGMVETPETYASTYVKEKANIQAARKMASGSVAGTALSSKDVGKVSEALRYRNLGIAISGVWGVSMLGQVTTSMVDHYRNRGADVMGKKWSMAPEGFKDSRMAHTTRQRALRAIQSSQSGYKRALGNEASYIHTYR